MSEFQQSKNLNWRQVFTKISNSLEDSFFSLRTIVGQLEAILKEIGTTVACISGFGLTLLRHPGRYFKETCFILVPIFILAAGAIRYLDGLSFIGMVIYFLLMISIASMFFYKLSDRLVKYAFLWYLLGIAMLLGSYLIRS